MNLVRAGHLHTPAETPSLLAEANDCSTATVAHVNEDGSVNLGVLDHDGLRTHGFTGIPVREPLRLSEVADDDPLNGVTFHLSADCPWKR